MVAGRKIAQAAPTATVEESCGMPNESENPPAIARRRPLSQPLHWLEEAWSIGESSQAADGHSIPKPWGRSGQPAMTKQPEAFR